MANRVLLGLDSGGLYGFKVSKAGANVLTAIAKDLLIDGSGTQFRVIQTGRVTMTTGSASVSISGVGSSDLFVIVHKYNNTSLYSRFPPGDLGDTTLTMEFDGTTLNFTRVPTTGTDYYDYAILAL